jgi:hypothetical protein
MKVALCLMFKDEHEYLEEWLDYHFSIGFDHVFIYDDESRVSTKDFIGGFPKYQGLVTVREAFHIGRKQVLSYQHMLDHNQDEYQWIAFLDTDEFLVIREDVSVSEFLKDYEEFGGLVAYWLCFGSNGHVKRQKGQIRPYTKRCEKTDRSARVIKSIVQPKYVANASGPHHFDFVDGYFAVDENKQRVACTKRDKKERVHTSDKICVHHYILRSREEFQEKIERGHGNNETNGKPPRFFEHRDPLLNAVVDEFLLNKVTTK